ncbi:hypothetical protein HL658_31245 [Azospirillum sp. RWY-5-1]|uniref:Uncharacterized protein n=1 Tax=Azospirillum oleiclasticum TaxID=2735135 RepID=A0ABX2TN11_9PROT|nr:hypothetical protein [Azospirillum oleiclasticum]NYZ17041.1 hypothetical protein [Azospirillum oleiclasticum]NYZ24515.1 hypothetical protein [Azospirillum oleiclasticum]
MTTDRLDLIARLTVASDRLKGRTPVGQRGRRELRALLVEARRALLAAAGPDGATADPRIGLAAAVERAATAGVAYPELVGLFNDTLDRLPRR